MRTATLRKAPARAGLPYLRLYGPLAPYLEKPWKPGEFELVK